MTGASKIEWTEQTWNPIVGCSIVSPGCAECYAMRMAARCEAMGMPHYAGTTKKVKGKAVWTGKLALAPETTLLAPLKRKKPTTYFVNSMGDLFHEDCPDEWIDRVFAVMALCPQHTFQVLTKRADRMREYFCKRRFQDVHPLEDRGDIISEAMNAVAPAHWCKRELHDYHEDGLPLPNVWLGVSAERQQEADERIPLLLQTPAAVRFVSAEPLLGAIDLTRVRAPLDPNDPESVWLFDSLSTGDMYEQRFDDPFGAPRYDSGDGPYREHKLDWLIVGGESGPGARPMHPDWARGLRDQCAAAGVAFFFKQWGEFAPHYYRDDGEPKRSHTFEDGVAVWRPGKANAGRHLNGVTHDAMPTREGT